jgi:hypothetical protein
MTPGSLPSALAGEDPTAGDDLLVRVEAETRPSRRGEVERELQRRLNRRLLSLPRSES